MSYPRGTFQVAGAPPRLLNVSAYPGLCRSLSNVVHVPFQLLVHHLYSEQHPLSKPEVAWLVAWPRTSIQPSKCACRGLSGRLSGSLSGILKPLQASAWRGAAPVPLAGTTAGRGIPPLASSSSRRLDAPAASGAFSAISEGDEAGSEPASGEHSSGRPDSGPRHRRTGARTASDSSAVMGIFARGAPEPSERGSFDEGGLPRGGGGTAEPLASISSRSDGSRSAPSLAEASNTPPAAPLAPPVHSHLAPSPSGGPSAKEILGPSPFSASFVELESPLGSLGRALGGPTMPNAREGALD